MSARICQIVLLVEIILCTTKTLSHNVHVHEQYSRVATNKPLNQNIRDAEPNRRIDIETNSQQKITASTAQITKTEMQSRRESQFPPIRFGRQQETDYYDDAEEEPKNYEPQCPALGSGLFSHPYDCSKFLNCHNGRTFVQDCGPGTLYNAELQVCDWPKNVKCTSGFTNSQNQYKKPKAISVTTDQIPAESYHIDVRHFSSQPLEYQPRPIFIHPSITTTQRSVQTTTAIRRRIIGMRQNHHTITTKTTTATPTKTFINPVSNFNKNYYNNKNISTVPSEDENAPDMTQLSEALKMLLKPYMKGAEPNIKLPEETKINSNIPTSKTYYSVSDEQLSLNGGFMPEPSRGSAEEIYEEFDSNRKYPTTAPAKRTEIPRPIYESTTTPTPPIYFNRNPKVVPLQPKSNECEFKCDNGKCIKKTQLCNGKNDCGDRTDETNCDHVGYEVRLSSQSGKKHEGRAEVKVFGQWGYICDDKFDMKSASVLCKELGFPMGASELRINSFYGPNARLTNGNDTVFIMDEVECTGNENSLRECDFNGWGIHDCQADEVVGVICKIPIMTCPVDYWLCEMSQECIPTNFLCDGVYDCSDQSDESTKFCNSSMELRLSDGQHKHEGRVEVKYRGVWGTICDDDFGVKEAKVICRQLGYEGNAVVIKTQFGPGAGPIWLDQVNCDGNETNIDECVHFAWGEHNCAHNEDVGVRCHDGYAKSNHAKVGKKFLQPQKTLKVEDFPFAEKSSKLGQEQCGHIKVKPSSDIIHEKVVRASITQRGMHPWQASIRAKKHGKSIHWCGAVLISRYHLLTAAHCLKGYPKGVYLVRIGDYNSEEVEPYEIEVNVENMYTHEDFRKGHHFNNDIAIVLLKNPVRFSDFIQPVCLPNKDAAYAPGLNCTISGWGAINSGSSLTSNDLRAGFVPIQPNTVCTMPNIYGENSITDGMFCAGTLDKGVDACDGDSGGPLVCEVNGVHTLYGVVSWGYQCGNVNKPGVYAKVSHYYDWIQQKLDHSMKNYGV